jgi:hypothetical protein
MTKEQAEFLVKVTEYAGNQEIDLREDYSGRNMYGKTTYGVVISSVPTLLADVILFLKETGLDGGIAILEQVPDFNDFRTDNMARDVILY